ncbi:RNA polymerase sigma factor [Pseudoxanthomonas wuyuanensis]|uniref:RNA polymerase sigma factor n=1 Tax=Pseudoxanthomonas wuyuanensis TaxID=1073196 RepID=A0A286DFT0_9GAMM|nr:sigma-70 family RNA polymerase sigma factor [Pseudoxanthomonas wuyuanensis]KAF1719675.1 sigma-70 family RNA polymerase sigma factor [Pseudoxanthomonas wuyuanensis]SOD57612.1 RNA polymerase sigma factor, sigma-70 family [Pseudoxanthomonas wuyuanensis]
MNVQALELMLQDALPAAIGGDGRAYTRIVAACQNTVTAIALAVTRDVQASEDIAQEAFLRAWQQLGGLKNPDSFLPWLRQITRNLARDHLRARRRQPLSGESAEIAISLAADTAPTPAERLLQTEQEQAAAEVIATLPADSREVLLLYYRESQNSQQVASLLGLTDAAVRKRLSRARRFVREALLERFGEFARTSAPSAAFASTVAGLLATATPPAAAATALTSGSALAGKGLLKLLGASAGAIAAGMLLAIGAVWFGIRKQLREPLDRQERDALLRYGAFNSALIVVFIVAAIGLKPLPGWIPHVSLTLLYIIGVNWSSLRWLPRILKRRRDRDLQLDPAGTALKLRKTRLCKVTGPLVGSAIAMAAILYALVATGRLIL